MTMRAALDEDPVGIGEITPMRVLLTGLPRELSAGVQHHGERRASDLSAPSRMRYSACRTLSAWGFP